MPSLRSLKARINSVNSTYKVTSAMKTVAMSKFNLASSHYAKYEAYYNACGEILDSLGGAGRFLPKGEGSGRKCYVLITSNRGLCGSYNTELLRYFKESVLSKGDKIIVCGKWAASRLGDGAENVTVSDVPSYQETEALFEKLAGLYESGEADEVSFVYQDYVNMLTHAPKVERLFPTDSGQGKSGGDIIYLPDRSEVAESALLLCLRSKVYGIMLKAATGAQAATLVAMRTASDNSEAMLRELEQTLNRMRQAMVTTEVIEVSSASSEKQNK